MKNQLIVFFIVQIVCSSIFLRQLDEVTKEACEKDGKTFQEGIPSTCKVSNYLYNVTKKEDCISGTWGDVERCSATEIETKTDCTGTPKFTEGSQTIPASCKLGDVVIQGLTDTNCEIALSWNQGYCSDSQYKKEEECTKAKRTWVAGSCSDGTSTTQGTCENKGTWTPGTCSDASKKTQSECEPDGTWTVGTCSDGTSTTQTACGSNTWTDGGCSNSNKKTPNDCNGDGESWNYGQCSDGVSTKNENCIAAKATWTPDSCTQDPSKKTQTECEEKGTWTSGSCSVAQFSESECKGTPIYTPEQKLGTCSLNGKNITSRITKSTCEVALTWNTVKGCNFKNLTTESECKAEAKFTEGTASKCLNSNFIKVTDLILVIIALLF